MFNPNGVGANVAAVNKIRHTSGDKGASNRSKLLEDFRYTNDVFHCLKDEIKF